MDESRQGELEDTLLAFVSKELVLVQRAEPIAVDDDLLSAGVVDSMGVMRLVTFIEDTLGVGVEDEDIVPENFRSIRTLATLVAAKRERAEVG